MNPLKKIFNKDMLAYLEKNSFTFSHRGKFSLDELRDRQIVIFGAGLYGRKIANTLRAEGIYPSFFVDTRVGTHPQLFQNYLKDAPIYPVETLASAQNPIVILSSAYAREMAYTCQRFAITDTILPIDLPLTSSAIPPIGARIEDYLYNDELEQVAALLDKKSLSVLKNFLSFQFTLDLMFIKEIYMPAPYFAADLLNCINYNIFCDLGASTGDTYAMYKENIKEISKQNRHFNADAKDRTYYAFEPDADSFNLLLYNIKDDANVYAFNCAVGASDQIGELYGSGMESSLVRQDLNVKRNIEIRCLDNFFEPYSKMPTCIKADIEGFEIEALKGSKKFLETNLPDLIFSIYHKRDDFIKIPLYIHNLDLGYRIHIRQQSLSYGETIVYATQQK